MASKSLDTGPSPQVKLKMAEVKNEDSHQKDRSVNVKHQDIVLLNVGGKR